jgi:hypothetical protein
VSTVVEFVGFLVLVEFLEVLLGSLNFSLEVLREDGLLEWDNRLGDLEGDFGELLLKISQTPLQVYLSTCTENDISILLAVDLHSRVSLVKLLESLHQCLLLLETLSLYGNL